MRRHRRVPRAEQRRRQRERRHRARRPGLVLQRHAASVRGPVEHHQRVHAAPLRAAGPGERDARVSCVLTLRLTSLTGLHRIGVIA